MEKTKENSIKKDLLRYCKDNVFSGCALGVYSSSETTFERQTFYVGKTDRSITSKNIDKACFFDTASLTKPFVTVLSLLALIREKKISFMDNLSDFFPLETPVDKKEITIMDLISHRSGLSAHKPFFNELNKIKQEDRKKRIISMILSEKTDKKNSGKYIYSDLDYILLGNIIEKISGENLGDYWRTKITDPLGISDHFYYPGLSIGRASYDFVVTGRCPWTDSKLSGLVNDDNCRSLGSLSGHAGLFATLEGVCSLAENILLQLTGKIKHPSLNEDDLRVVALKSKKDNSIAGFDTPTGLSSASGKYFSEGSIGHLGFTGTSFWIDLLRKKVIVLLTNRVVFGDDQTKIKKVRPLIHNKVMKQFLEK